MSLLRFQKEQHLQPLEKFQIPEEKFRSTLPSKGYISKYFFTFLTLFYSLGSPECSPSRKKPRETTLASKQATVQTRLKTRINTLIISSFAGAIDQCKATLLATISTSHYLHPTFSKSLYSREFSVQ